MLDGWNSRFPYCEPIAHHLRKAFASRWVRFHGLPDPQRYPVDKADYARILGRWNRVLHTLVGPEGGIVLLTTEGRLVEAGETDPDPDESSFRTLAPHARPWRTVRIDLVDPAWDARTEWRISASRLAWVPGSLDEVLRLVIDGIAPNVMIVDPGCRWLATPYDGGMDLILEDRGERDRLRSTYSEWLSSHPEGL